MIGTWHLFAKRCQVPKWEKVPGTNEGDVNEGRYSAGDWGGISE